MLLCTHEFFVIMEASDVFFSTELFFYEAGTCLVIIYLEFLRTYIAQISKVIFLPIVLKLFFYTFLTPRPHILQ